MLTKNAVALGFIFSFAIGGGVGYLAWLGGKPADQSRSVQEQVLPKSSPQAIAVYRAEPISLEELQAALANPTVWRQQENRVANVSARFQLLAKESGAASAISRSLELFGHAQIPRLVAAACIESIVLTVWGDAPPNDAELSALMAKAGDFFPPLARGIAFGIAKNHSILEIQRRLDELAKGAGIGGDPRVRGAILNAAVQAGDAVDLATLKALTTALAPDAKKYDVVGAIAKAVAATDLALAIRYLADVSGRDGKLFANQILGLKLNKAELQTLMGSLDAKALGRFAEDYLTLAPMEPQFAADFSEIVAPEQLSANARQLLAARLLNASTNVALNWLGRLPAEERTSVLNSLMSKPGYVGVSPVNWLSAAATCEDISQENWQKAVHDAIFHLPPDEVAPYLEKLSGDRREREERTLYVQELMHLRGKSAGELKDFVESKPIAFRSALYTAFGAANPAEALQLWQQSSDAQIKRSLENGLLGSELPLDEYEKVLSSRLQSPDILKSGSIAANHYVSRLLQSDSGRAVQFIANLPESPLKNETTRSLAAEWAGKDPQSASGWILQMPAGESRDIAIQQLAQASRDQPENTFTNIASMTSEKLRVDAASALVDWWKGRDPKRMSTIIAGSGLPENERTSLLKRLTP